MKIWAMTVIWSEGKEKGLSACSDAVIANCEESAIGLMYKKYDGNNKSKFKVCGIQVPDSFVLRAERYLWH